MAGSEHYIVGGEKKYDETLEKIVRVLGWLLAGEHTKMSAALKITVGYDGKIFGRNGKNERKKKSRHDPKKKRSES